MAQMEVAIDVRVNWGRAHSLMQQAKAAIRKTKKGERQAVMHRFVRSIRETCLRVGVRPKS